MQIKSKIQIGRPNTGNTRMMPQTQWPSLNLVMNPKIQAVIGIIAKIKLTSLDRPN